MFPPQAARLMWLPLLPMPGPAARKPPQSPAIQDTPIAEAADISIVADVGPEVISGSTRMKAGTAQKMILNMITTGAMTRLGYVYENLMVNVHMQNSKLVERGIRILMGACNIDRADRRQHHQERRPQRSRGAGDAEGQGRQAGSRSPPGQVRRQRSPGHRRQRAGAVAGFVAR